MGSSQGPQMVREDLWLTCTTLGKTAFAGHPLVW